MGLPATELPAMELIVAELSIVRGTAGVADKHRLAVELSRTREVLRLGPMTPVPTAPPSIIGAMNASGQVLPVIDVGLMVYGVPSTPSPGDSGLLASVVTDRTGRARELTFVLFVGRVLEVTRAAATGVLPPRDDTVTDDGLMTHALTGTLTTEIGPVELLDVTALARSLEREVDVARQHAFGVPVAGAARG